MFSLDRALILKFRKVVQEEIESLRYDIAQGNVSDIIVYKELCSKVSGLALALSLFDDLVNKLNQDQDDLVETSD